ncbi:L-ornithine N(5)-monooxygenase (L-ornithine N(5)-oxygenase) [Durusdinium trenchii]
MSKKNKPLPDFVDVLIIGAGPHGLAMGSRLVLGNEAMDDVIPPIESYVRRPRDVRAHLQKLRSHGLNLAFVDEGGTWMGRWKNQFAALGISHLRSHEMMHPDAFDHSTLSVWAQSKKRNDFLFLEDLPKNKAYHGPFVLPSHKLMLDFCKALVKLNRLEDHLWHAHAETLRPSGSGVTVTLKTATGTKAVHAKHVVVARGPTWRRQWPAFYNNLEASGLGEIHHAWDLFDQPEKMEHLKGRGVIIGGGLTSAHLCNQLAGRGHIDLLLRRDRRVKQYDLALDWMGYKRWDHRREFEQASIEQRARINKRARDGGSISPELNSVLTDLEAKGQVSVHEWLEVETACYHGAGWTLVLSSGEVMEADYLICATGALVDVATDPLLAGLQEAHPLKMKNGLPVLTENLQWGRLPVYLMGNLAALHLGPDAVNMTGAARGALRIWSALSGCEGCEVS